MPLSGTGRRKKHRNPPEGKRDDQSANELPLRVDNRRSELCCRWPGRAKNQVPRRLHSGGSASTVEALPPLDNKIRRNRHAAYRLDLKPRVQVNEILRSGSRVGQNPKIVADRKESIERSEAVVAR